MIRLSVILPTNIPKFNLIADGLKPAVAQALRDGLLLVKATSQTKYLSGPYPSVLSPENNLLRSSIYSDAWEGGGTKLAEGHVGAGKWYGIVHETGKPAIIRATGTSSNIKKDLAGYFGYGERPRSKYLHFFWHRKGIWMKIKQVKTVKRPFLLPALEERLPDVLSLIQKAIINTFATQRP